MILLLLIAQIEVASELKREYLNKTLTIGDPFEIIVTAKYPQSTDLSEPFVDSLEPFLIIEQNSQSVEEQGLVKNTYNIKMVPFGTGELRIPAFKFLHRMGDVIDTLSSNEISLKIASVMADDMEDINDIKKAVEFPNFLPLIIAGIVIAVLVLSYLAYRYIGKLRRMRAVAKPLPPPWAEAIAALEGIPMEDWLARGFFKRYYYAISETLKRYLERRFAFSAAEQTTTEIVTNLKKLKIPQHQEFNEFFTRADVVKYAKYIPPDDEIRVAVQIAKDLVMKTKPEETVEND